MINCGGWYSVPIDWAAIKHFSPKENWGDIDLIDPRLIGVLDEYRDDLGHAVHISPAVGAVCAQDGHSKDSYHYPVFVSGKLVRPCQAADVFPDCDLETAWLCAMRHPAIMGIGIYPCWRYQDEHLSGGLHLDIRATPRRAMWWQDIGGYKNLRTWDDIYLMLSYIH